MRHDTKINQALAKSNVGRYPRTAAAMLDYVPVSVVARCTSAELAEMLDELHRACLTSKSIERRDTIDEGAIWIEGRGMVELPCTPRAERAIA